MIDLLEYEMKFMLSPEEYKILYGAFNALAYTQTNFYYDTQDFSYNRKGITCRIREKGNRYTATIKEHRLNTLNCSEEKTIEVKNEYDTSLFEGMNLSLQGVMQTHRKDILLSNGIRIAIDKNIYLGTEDYELEIEYDPLVENTCSDTLHAVIMVLLKQGLDSSIEDFHNRMKYSCTKSERFFAQKSKTEGGV